MEGLEKHSFTYSDDNKEVFYVAVGPKHGPLIIFIHGWPALGCVWRKQLLTFAGLGFRCLAPDMPGYGKSHISKNPEDYAQKEIHKSMLALLHHTGRSKALWIGHDWGCGSVWTFAAHYPSKCVGVVGMTVPYGHPGLGLDAILKTINRDIYPENEYPYGQWSYMKFYETNASKAAEDFDADVRGVVKVLYSKGNPAGYGKPAFTASVSKNGGWFGGGKPDPKFREIPLETTVLDEAAYEEVCQGLEKNGFTSADAWYLNHERNRAYTLEATRAQRQSQPQSHSTAASELDEAPDVHMPVLFVHARFDHVCSTLLSPKMCEAMRRHCRDLTEVQIDAGHWVAEEKPEEVSAAVARWVLESCREWWPGYWERGFVRK